MTNDVWSTDREGSIQHTQKKYKSITFIACGILPLAPHECVSCIAPVGMWHHCTDDDGDENPSDNQNTVDGCKHGQRPVHIENHNTADPGENEVRHEDMPPLRCELWMKGFVHGDRHFSTDLNGSSQT